MKNLKGSVTVEAAVIMPVYILLLVFLINFLNIFYLHLVVQSGLNNAANALSQYCYAIDLTLGMENFSLTESSSRNINTLKNGVESFSVSTRNMATSFNDAFTGEFSLDELAALLDSGKAFVDASNNLGTAMQAIDGETVKNYLLTSAGEVGGGMIVESMVESYLDDMKVNRNLIVGDIQYSLYIADFNTDLVLTACYQYKNADFSMFMSKPFVLRQQVVIHPWIGGTSDGLRKK